MMRVECIRDLGTSLLTNRMFTRLRLCMTFVPDIPDILYFVYRCFVEIGELGWFVRKFATCLGEISKGEFVGLLRLFLG